MKESKFNQWENKHIPSYKSSNELKYAWNAALKKSIRIIKYKHKLFEGNWQHEDIEYLIEALEEMIEV